MSDVYVMGIDMIKFGRYPEKTVPGLGSEAALLALDDAGVTIQDCEALQHERSSPQTAPRSRQD